MGGLGVKFQHFPLTLLVVLTTLTLPCERDTSGGVKVCGARDKRSSCRPSLPEVPADLGAWGAPQRASGGAPAKDEFGAS